MNVSSAMRHVLSRKSRNHTSVIIVGSGFGGLAAAIEIVFLLERQASHVRQAVEWLESKLDRTVFTDNCPGWYTNEQGKVTAMRPASRLAHARATRRFDPSELDDQALPEGIGAPALAARQSAGVTR